MPDIRDQQFLYHITDLNNVEPIFSDGLKSRSLLRTFSDIADSEIIASRRTFRLEEYVPFHFFAGNPFDGRVHLDYPDKKFVLLTVRRSYAQEHNWQVITRHPLSGTAVKLLDYQAGMQAINWDVMNIRDYRNNECRCICMAECLSPDTVPASVFHCIYTPDKQTEKTINELKQKYNLRIFVNNSPNMFPGV